MDGGRKKHILHRSFISYLHQMSRIKREDYTKKEKLLKDLEGVMSIS